MNTFTGFFSVVTRCFSFLFFLAVAQPLLNAQCTLSGTYNNTASFQSALDNLAPTCNYITLTGSAQYSGNITVPSKVTLIIAGSAIINGSGTFISNNPVVIETGGSFVTNGNSVTVAGYTYSSLGTVIGYTVLNGTAILNVEWADLSAKSKGKINEIQWSTQSEENLSHFIIERSADAVRFQAIGEEKAAGGLQQKMSYIFEDETPSVTSSISYYRIKSVDNNGKTIISKLVSVKNAGKETAMKVFPTVQVGSSVTVELTNLTTQSQLHMVNMMGQVVAQVPLQTGLSEQTLSISTSDLISGVYFISLTNNGKRTTQKFVKW